MPMYKIIKKLIRGKSIFPWGMLCSIPTCTKCLIRIKEQQVNDKDQIPALAFERLYLRVAVDNDMFHVYDISEQWDILLQWLCHSFDLLLSNHFDKGCKIITQEK